VACSKNKNNEINFYIGIGPEDMAAISSCVHFKRFGFKKFYSELNRWLLTKIIEYKDKNIEKVYNTIEWWDLYIKENNDIYSDAKETNKIRDNIDEKYQKYLNCLFCIKRKVK